MMNLIDQAYTVNNKTTPVTENPASVNVEERTPSPLKQEPISVIPETKTISMRFEEDKETFLKACENMFDALISKYQKELDRLHEKEQELLRKEQEINIKMNHANEHLANAEAKEQIANIAHDNAQKVMDLNNFMPVNPNSNPEN